ncbi:acylphosphatase [Sphingomonas sp. RHCKR47]|uniref:acylphosphatase n=1 Tax=Sphingomonas citricola TaxID=2862498 RepID=UPI001CA492AF|nr:acylphosphatase [Sphingomonas citricola]MBW6524123.1 acylphosphatase [Sphingomonas citricola]
MIRRRLVVTGRVQGVFFRDWTVEQARSLGLDGWVRNRADGSVEAVVAGAPEKVEAMIERAHRGPSAARVDDVAVSEDAPAEVPDGFEKRPTR